MKTPALVRRLIPVVHEDDLLLAVHKPAGLDTTTPPGGRAEGAVEIVAALRGRGETLRPINRLSRYESGILLLAKDPATAQFVRTGLRTGAVQQEYVAVVHGRPARPHLVVGAEHGRSRGRGAGRARRVPGLKAVATQPAEKQTAIQVLKSSERLTLVRCRTCAPTTHALRAQLRAVELRLAGDILGFARPRDTAAETFLHLAQLSFPHPHLRTRVTLKCPASRHVEPYFERRRDTPRILHAALARRAVLLASDTTDAYRLIHGADEDLPGLVAERFGEVAILQALDDSPVLHAELPAIAEWYRATLGLSAVYLKQFVKDRVRADLDVLNRMKSPQPFVGGAVPEEIAIRERDLVLAIRPYHGFSAGLFLDQRDNRERIRTLAAGRAVLNLFAYTCGFSVAAAAGGAATTVSVDLSPTHLEWGKRNFELNGLPLDAHQFIRSDAAGYLQRAARQGKAFDLIVLDPPSFAHGRKAKASFSIERDLAALVRGAVQVLNPGGVLLLATNFRRMTLGDLRRRLAAGAGSRKFRVVETPGLPVDFAPDPDFAKSLFAEFS